MPISTWPSSTKARPWPCITPNDSPAGQRIVLYAKDRGCSAPGCDVAGYYCEVHHVENWASTHTTDINQLTLTCPPNHKLVRRPNGDRAAGTQWRPTGGGGRGGWRPGAWTNCPPAIAGVRSPNTAQLAISPEPVACWTSEACRQLDAFAKCAGPTRENSGQPRRPARSANASSAASTSGERHTRLRGALVVSTMIPASVSGLR